MMNTHLPIREIAPNVYVAPQLEPTDMAEVARLGFAAVINNRPDGEGGPEQPLNTAVQAAAAAVGLNYQYLPVEGAYQSPEEIAAFGQLLAQVPRPLLCFCRSGARSTRLYVAATGA